MPKPHTKRAAKVVIALIILNEIRGLAFVATYLWAMFS